MNFFRHEHSGQQEGVISGIVDDTQEVEYSLWKEMKVGAGPEQSGVSVGSRYFQLTCEIY